MTYRDTTVYVYSGTGNSRRVALWLAEAAGKAGSSVTFAPIGSADPDQGVGYGRHALLGLVMPTHGFTAPWAVLRFALLLPRRRDTHAVIVATRGGLKIGPIHTPGFEGSTTLLVALILAVKGYRVRGTAGMDMPSNWTAFHPGLPPLAVESIIKRARARMDRFSTGVLSGERRPSNWPVWLLGLLLLPLSLAYLLLGRIFLAKLFFASDRCISCGLCAAHCPNQAIEMRGDRGEARPYWTTRCESCMRCMAYCPVGAVEASHLLAIGAYLMARVLPTAIVLTWLAARTPLPAVLGRVPRGLVVWTTALLVLMMIYPLFHRLLGIGPLNRFFTRATLTSLYRRYHEPATTLQDLHRRERWT